MTYLCPWSVALLVTFTCGTFQTKPCCSAAGLYQHATPVHLSGSLSVPKVGQLEYKYKFHPIKSFVKKGTSLTFHDYYHQLADNTDHSTCREHKRPTSSHDPHHHTTWAAHLQNPKEGLIPDMHAATIPRTDTSMEVELLLSGIVVADIIMADIMEV